MQKLWAARKTYRTKYPDLQETLWIAPKGKPVVRTIRMCHLFLEPTKTLELKGWWEREEALRH
jgi:hypothetical protein